MNWKSKEMRKPLSSLITTALVILSSTCFLEHAVGANSTNEQVKPFDRPERADGARVTPDKLLRGYDPITVFFTSDIGASSNKVEDNAEKYVTL